MNPLSIRVKLFGGIGLALAILAATAFASWRSLQLLLEAQDLVAHTREVIAVAERLLVETLDTQTGARGFVITGDEVFLEPFHAAQAALPGRMTGLRKLTADHPGQQERLDELERLSRARQEIASQVVRARRERGFDSAELTPLVRRGKETMDEIRQVVRAMKREEEVRLTLRTAETRRHAERTLLTILLGSAAGFGLVGFASFRSYQEIQARQRAEAEVRRASAEIEDLYNNAPCGYHSVNFEGVFVAINDTELAWFGRTREEIIGKLKHRDLVTPGTRAAYDGGFARFKQHGAVHDLEFKITRRDGTERDVLLNATSVLDPSGKLLHSRSTMFDITARKQAEAERDRFFNISLDLLCVARAADGKFVRVSPGVTDLLGWSPEEFLAMPYMEQIHPEDRAASQAEVERQTVRGEKVLHFENRFRHKDGSWRVLSWRSVPQPGGLMYAAARDITERKRMEQELRDLNERLEHRVAERTAELAAAEGKFRTLVEQSLVGIYVIQDGRYHYLNPRMLELFGYTEAEFMARPVPDYIFEADREMVLENIRRRLAGEVPSIRYQLRMLRRDGSVLHVEVHGARSEFNGRPAIMGTLLDITERKRAEERLADERELLRTLIDNLPGFIFVKDPAGRYLISNQPHTRLLGRAAEADLLGRTVYDFFPPEVAKVFEASDEAVLAGQPLLEREEQFIFERKPVWHAVTKVPLRDRQGRITGLIGIKHDITGRKLSEEKLRQFATRLARSNRELQDFAFVASHDLQEPLRKIQAFSDRLKLKCGPALDDTGRDYLARMVDAAGRMRRLIDDLLMFSRVTSKAKPFEPVDLAAVARGVLSDLEIRLEQTGGKVEVGPLPTLDADPTQMRQLLQNLVGNALKFRRPEVPPLVAVWGDQQDGHVRLSIADNGIGFDEKYTDRIFQVFQRLHGRAEYEGSGIGLAVCRKIAERHGGSINARSTPGVGSTFTVTLPLRQANPNPTHDAHA